MAEGTTLGEAILELDATLAPLAAKLDAALALVSKKTAEMQAILDSLHGNAELGVGGVVGGVPGVTRSTVVSTASREEAPGRGFLGAGFEIGGVRGKAGIPGTPGNPLVVVLEAGSRTPLGALAAGIGEYSTAAATSAPAGGDKAAVASMTERQLIDAVAKSNKESNRELTRAFVAAPTKTEGQRESGGGGFAAVPAGRRAPRSESDLTAISAAFSKGNRIQEAAILRELARRGEGDFANTLLASQAGRGGGGGGGLLGGLLGGAAAGGGGNGLLHKVLWGGGLLGLAGFGTLGSFAGLGAEHALLTGGGILGSAGAAAAGGGLLAAGAAGSFAVGGGSDIAVLKSSLTDTKELGKAYQELAKAQAVYGKGSQQAAEKQKELNFLIKELGDTAGVKAEIGLAKQVEALNHFWDKATSTARVRSVEIFSQVVSLAQVYVPKVASAAATNLGIINQDIKPLFAWLKGPEGMGIWDNLERVFRENLPTAIHAATQGVEFLLKTVNDAADFTGGFTRKIDEFFTKWNEPKHFAVWHSEMEVLINDFRVWGTFFKLLGQDIFDLFTQDAHTGRSIIESLNGMLLRLREWERSTQGAEKIHNIFFIHREEVIALLRALTSLADPFAHLYLTLAPLAVPVVTALANAFGDLVKGIDSLGSGAATLAGLFLVMWKIGALAPTIKALGAAFGILATNEKEAAGATTLLGGATQTSVAEGVTRIPSKTPTPAAFAAGGSTGLPTSLGAKLIRGAAGGVLGGVAANSVANLAGVHGSANTILTAAGAGAGIGLSFGPWGAAAGAALGAALGGAMTLFNHHATDYGKEFAKNFVSPLGPLLTKNVAKEYQHGIDKAFNEVHGAQENLAKEGPGKLFGIKLAPGGSPKELAHLWNVQFQKEFRLAQWLSEALKHGLAGVQHLSTFGFTQDIVEKLKGTSGETQKAVADMMVKWAATLEHEGKLPKGAVEHVLKSLESRFPELQKYFQEHSEQTSAEVASAFKLEAAQHNLIGALQNIRSEFGLLNINPEVNGKNFVKNLSVAMGDLKHVVATETGETKKVAEEQLRKLTQQGDYYFESLLHKTQVTMGKLGPEVRKGVGGAAKEAEKGMEGFTNAIVGAMESGAISSQKGSELIGKAINAKIVALGGTKLPETSVKIAGAVAGAAAAATKKLRGGFAGGALMQIGQPGEAGYDSVPMNVGGQNVVVAPGEQVAVFNRHQLPIVNSALAGIGGLEGLFSSVTRPNYMAGGGMLTKMVSEANTINAQHFPYLWGGGHNSNFTGPYDCSGAVSAVLHSAGLLARPEVSGELASFGLPGPGEVTIYANPVHTFMSIAGKFFGTHGSEGAGWYAGSALPGFTVRHAPIGAGESFGEITAPHVTGKGAVARLVQRGLNKEAAAGNRYLEKHAVAGTVSSAAGGAHGGFNKAQLESLWKQAGGSPSMAGTMAAIAIAESGGNPQALNPSGASGLWQILGVPFPGNPFDPLTNARMAVAKFKSQGLGAWVTYTSGAYRQFLGKGGIPRYAGGGMIGYASGGPVVTGQHLQSITGPGGKQLGMPKPASYGHSAKKNPKAPAKPHIYKGSLTLPWNPPENKELYELGNLVETGIPGAQEAYTNASNVYGLTEWGSGEFAFIVTEGPYGETISPYENVGNVHARQAQLFDLVHKESEYKNLLVGAVHTSVILNRWTESEIAKREARIAALNKAIAGLKKKIEANIARLRQLKKHLSILQHPKHGKPNAAAVAETKALITGLERDNVRMGGSPMEVGTGGQLKWFEGEKANAESQLTALGERHTTLSEDTKNFGGVGEAHTGGAIAEAGLALSQLGKQVEELEPGSLAKALIKAQHQAGPTSAETELRNLEKEKNLQLSQELAVSQAQYKVFASLPPFGGSFAQGGIVPGPIGAPRMIMAHGGELVSNGGVQVNHYWADGMQWLSKFVRTEVKQGTRVMARNAGRRLPSAGGAAVA